MSLTEHNDPIDIESTPARCRQIFDHDLMRSRDCKVLIENNTALLFDPAIILTRVKKTDPTSPEYATDYLYYALLSTAVLCGLRRAELLGLKRDDLNFKAGCIHIQRSLYKGEMDDTKSKYSRWSVEMPPMLQNILRQHMLLSPDSKDGLLFCDNEGQPLSSTRVSKN